MSDYDMLKVIDIEYLKQKRLASNLTQCTVANLLLISVSDYSNKENGKSFFTTVEVWFLKVILDLNYADIGKIFTSRAALERI
ncbi:helix-turn-helix transcriptional regulator [Acidaminobacter sp. JC074]|uniref:helix-turn-helix domain-containing protein n=1 Tax=Acidaminobacter sp. JC074 TaxID=2530199 RepID=UPI001F0F8783|nr:helix-turn-helix domain-containing protein [Acidaminobacter sp. JC074]MCH4891212.1 helix-turn-helix transcriptional regulator [Acidaminobacter sp. JC074]